MQSVLSSQLHDIYNVFISLITEIAIQIKFEGYKVKHEVFVVQQILNCFIFVEQILKSHKTLLASWATVLSLQNNSIIVS
jgi:hypothetical protein